MKINNLFGEECHLDQELMYILMECFIEPRSFDRAYLDDLRVTARDCGFLPPDSPTNNIDLIYRLKIEVRDRFTQRRADLIVPFERFLKRNRYSLYLEGIDRDADGNDVEPFWYVTDGVGAFCMRVRRLDEFVNDHPLLVPGRRRRSKRSIAHLRYQPGAAVTGVRTYYARP